MTWRSFLGCASSMIALHDSDATPGPGKKSSREPEKPDRNNAYWLDLGIRLLTYLQAQEEHDNQPMVALEAFLQCVRADYPDVTLEDVRHCAQRLARPTTIMCFATTGKVDPVETALLLRPHDSLAAVRLSPQGRQALGFSTSLGDTQFADLDAQKMRRLVEDGQYDRAREACAELLTRLRGTSHQLTEADERLGAEDLRQHFISNGASYMGSVDATQTIVQGSLEFIDSLLDRKRSTADYVALVGLRDELRTLLTACQRLDRRLARLLKRLNERPATAGRIFRFDHLLAHWLVADAPSTEILEAMADIAAPAEPAWCPVEMFALEGCVDARTTVSDVERVLLRPLVDPADTVQAQRLSELLEAYSAYLGTAIDGVPVSLFSLLSSELPMLPASAEEISALYGSTLAARADPGGVALGIEVTPAATITTAQGEGGEEIRGHDIFITRNISHEPG